MWLILLLRLPDASPVWAENEKIRHIIARAGRNERRQNSIRLFEINEFNCRTSLQSNFIIAAESVFVKIRRRESRSFRGNEENPEIDLVLFKCEKNGIIYGSAENKERRIYMTKVDIISGFLGAGKTTFIKQLVSSVFQGEKIVLIENEFGEIGIDGGFLKEAGIEITEMNSGCICCTLVGDFSTALKKVVEEYHPDRILIEPSGVGKLSDVAKAVEAVREQAEIVLNSRITVVDGKKAKLYMKNFGEFYNNQIEHATTIVLSRTQMMTEEKLQTCVEQIRKENQTATLITTPWDQLNGEVIRQALEHSKDAAHLISEECNCHEHHHDHEEGCSCHEHHHDHEEGCSCHEHHHDHEEGCGCHEHHHEESCGCHEHHQHHADEVFASWGRETVKKYTKEEVETLLKAFSETEAYGEVLRAKGIVQGTEGNWIEFDYVPQEYEIRDGHPDYTGKICVIGTKLNEEALDRL